MTKNLKSNKIIYEKQVVIINQITIKSNQINLVLSIWCIEAKFWINSNVDKLIGLSSVGSV